MFGASAARTRPKPLSLHVMIVCRSTVKPGALEAGILGLVVFYAAYLPVFRSALAGVHDGRRESAHAPGMSGIGTLT